MKHRRTIPIVVQVWFIAVVVTLASVAECRAGGRIGVVAGGGAGGGGAAGSGEKGFDGGGGPAAKAKFGNVYCLAFDDRKEKLYIADLDNRRIRMIDMKTGIVTTHAGNGQKGVPADDAAAAEAPLLDPR